MRKKIGLGLSLLSFVSILGFNSEAKAQSYGSNSAGEPFCTYNYSGANTNGYGWQDTNGDGVANSCVIQKHKYGYQSSGVPNCSKVYRDEITSNYGWEDTDAYDGKNSCFANSSVVYHFGQPVKLVGANIPWVDYGADISPYKNVNLQAFSNWFDAISVHGGNSARIWLHIEGMVTPKISSTGVVSGIGANATENQKITAQVKQILDLAWSKGILVDFSLFSFSMLCTSNGFKGSIYKKMLRDNPQSYINNVLKPLVTATKDHPALFAWEIFNESDGMTIGQDFISSPDSVCTGAPTDLWVFQRFANFSSAAIKSIDKNVRVTSSLGVASRFNTFTNAELTNKSWSLPSGILDFYQLHWYPNQPEKNPYSNLPSSYGLNRPIVIGEFEPTDFTTGTYIHKYDLAKKIIQNGYLGAWIWSYATITDPNDANSNIYNASQPALNKTAIQACITNKDPACYIK